MPEVSSIDPELVDKIIHSATYDVVLTGAEALAIYYVPVLGVTPLYQVFHFLLQKIGDLIYRSLGDQGVILAYKFNTEEERAEYAKAKENVRETLKTKEGVPDAAAIAKAKEAFKKRLADLVHIGPK